jgi:NitT/TauT family transport system substrate-binding protein/putative hydroxymethylpyrimidine transport system substrate-binding protein
VQRIAASLAAVLALLAPIACGDGGAEPDAPPGGASSMPGRELDLILDFQPNAVHAGLYSALAGGHFAERGIELTVREPGSATDAPKLLESGRVDLAIMDIHDLAISREAGFDLVGIGAIVQRPLAAVIAADPERFETPADLFGAARIGVTGLPSDDAVLDAVLGSSGVDGTAPETVTIGFQSVAALSSGRVDAATAFWNAEGVALEELGVATREFRVDDFGAPAYPELVLVTRASDLERDRELLADALAALAEGTDTAASDPDLALEQMGAELPELDADTLAAQMAALDEADAFSPPVRLDPGVLGAWARWDAENGIVDRPPSVERSFDTELAGGG